MNIGYLSEFDSIRYKQSGRQYEGYYQSYE